MSDTIKSTEHAKPFVKAPKRKVNGVLLLDKASGVSSNTALQQVRRLYRADKAGHTGVLDPLATGLLPVCFGESTKFAQYLLDADKGYVADVRFGAQTSTADAEGEIIAEFPVEFDSEMLQAALMSFLGDIEQIPPMYSALKHQGKALYEYARKGIEIERKIRQVRIYDLDLLECVLPDIKLNVTCSKGTYIRTLAEDIAKKLHSGAYLTALRRTKTAGFSLTEAHSFESLSLLNEDRLDGLLLPSDTLVSHLPQVMLSLDDATRLKLGQKVRISENCGKIGVLRAYVENMGVKEFVGLVGLGADNVLKAVRLMAT